MLVVLWNFSVCMCDHFFLYNHKKQRCATVDGKINPSYVVFFVVLAKDILQQMIAILCYILCFPSFLVVIYIYVCIRKSAAVFVFFYFEFFFLTSKWISRKRIFLKHYHLLNKSQCDSEVNENI